MTSLHALACGIVRVAREGEVGGGRLRLLLQLVQCGSSALGRGRDALLQGAGAARALAVLVLDGNAGAARFGEPDGDRLLGVLGAVLAFADVVDLLAHEFTRRGARGFPVA